MTQRSSFQSFNFNKKLEENEGELSLGFRIVKTPVLSNADSAPPPKELASNPISEEPLTSSFITKSETKIQTPSFDEPPLSPSPDTFQKSNIMYFRWFNRPLPHPNSKSKSIDTLRYRAKQEFRSGGPLFIGTTSDVNFLVGNEPSSNSKLQAKKVQLNYYPPEINIFKCFNCDRPDHQLSACPFPYHHPTVTRNRSLYDSQAESQKSENHFGDFPPPQAPIKFKSSFKNSHSDPQRNRYFSIGADPATFEDLQMSNLHQYQPGQCSPKLMEALGIQIPSHAIWIRNIAIYGYPSSYIGPLPPFELLDLVDKSWRETKFGPSSSFSIRSKRTRTESSSSDISLNSLRNAVLRHWWFYVSYFSRLPAVYFEDFFDFSSLPDFSTFTSIDELAKFCCSALSSRIILQYLSFKDNPELFSISFDPNTSILTVDIPPNHLDSNEKISLVIYDKSVLPIRIGHLIQYPTINIPPYLLKSPVHHVGRRGLTLDEINSLDSSVPNFEKHSRQIYGKRRNSHNNLPLYPRDRAYERDYDPFYSDMPQNSSYHNSSSSSRYSNNSSRSNSNFRSNYDNHHRSQYNSHPRDRDNSFQNRNFQGQDYSENRYRRG